MLKTFINRFFLIASTCALIACGDGSSTEETTTLTITKPKQPVVILVYGDSISQGYGIDINGEYFQQVSPGNTFTELLRLRIKNEKLDEFASVTVVNDSLGGEFTSQAVARLPSVLAFHRPTHVVLAHGANDVGGQVPLSTISNNFITMINMAKGNGAKVLLADVTPSLFGIDFANNYSKMVSDTAYRLAVTYVPLLKDVFGNPVYLYPDGVHFKDSAQNIILNNLWEKLVSTIK
jgi:acyl-CoA thioesterase-1